MGEKGPTKGLRKKIQQLNNVIKKKDKIIQELKRDKERLFDKLDEFYD